MDPRLIVTPYMSLRNAAPHCDLNKKTRLVVISLPKRGHFFLVVIVQCSTRANENTLSITKENLSPLYSRAVVGAKPEY